MATPADAPAIAAVMHQSFVEFESSYTEEGFLATVLEGGGIISRMNEGPIWAAVNEGAIVGAVSVVPRGDSLYIRGMATLPTARRSGVGASLLEHVEAFASNNHYGRLYLSTTPFLAGAIRLYERMGFERTTAGPFDLKGTPLFTMEKRIPVGRATDHRAQETPP